MAPGIRAVCTREMYVCHCGSASHSHDRVNSPVISRLQTEIGRFVPNQAGRARDTSWVYSYIVLFGTVGGVCTTEPKVGHQVPLQRKPWAVDRNRDFNYCGKRGLIQETGSVWDRIRTWLKAPLLAAFQTDRPPLNYSTPQPHQNPVDIATGRY